MTTMTKLRIAILSKLSAGDMSTREIGPACDRAPAELGIAMSRLVSCGFVRCVGTAPSSLRGCKPRVFRITDKGLEALVAAPLMVGRSDRARVAETERQKAMAAGEKRYLGKPCPHGHAGLRYVSNSTCIQCASDAVYARIERRAAA